MPQLNRQKKSAGFTLIETIIYVALFAIIIGGGLVGAYGIIEGTDRTSSKTIMEQDASFVLRKIDWSLTGLATVNSTGKSLSINKSGFTNNPLVFSLVGSNIGLRRGSGSTVILNSSRNKFSNLLFSKVTSGGKDGVQATFTVTSVDGKLSEDFSVVKYARHD